LAEELDGIDLDKFLVNGIWPSDAISPAELGTEGKEGIDAVDHMADFLAKRRK